MEDNTRKNLSDLSTWTRVLYIALYVIAFNVAEAVIAAITIIQFFTVLLTGRVNTKLAELGSSVGDYLAEVTAFLTYKSDHKPFPVSEWGQGPERPSERAEAGRAKAAKSGATIKTPAKKKAAAKKKTAKKKR